VVITVLYCVNDFLFKYARVCEGVTFGGNMFVHVCVCVTSWKKYAFRPRIVQFDTSVHTTSIRENSQVRCV